MTDVADKALNEGQEVKIADKIIKIKKFSFMRHTALVSGLLAKTLPKIANSGHQLEVAAVIFEMLSTDFDTVIKLISDVTGLSKKEMEELEKIEEMAVLDIAMNVYEVNKSFLSQAAKRLGM